MYARGAIVTLQLFNLEIASVRTMRINVKSFYSRLLMDAEELKLLPGRDCRERFEFTTQITFEF